MLPRPKLTELILLSILLGSCGFVDLRPIGINTVPEGPWAILPEAESHIVISFNTEMEKLSAEKAVQINSPSGAAGGDFRWAGNTLCFIPSAPWMTGIRYSLKLSGTVSAIDGRELLLSRDIPFFAVSRSPLPYIESFYPPDGISVGVSLQKILELNFSSPMDTRSAEEALKFDIPGNKIFNWQDGDRTLIVSSDKPLDPWIVYKWAISEKAANKIGAPLAKEFSGRFITDLNREFIGVVRFVPLLAPESPGFSPGSMAATWLWGGWVPSGLSMEQGLGSGQGIGVEFSREADSESLRRAFSFTPSLPGRVEILSPTSAVYIPSKDPEPDVIYSLRISGAVKDTDGLKMGEDYTVVFGTDIPYLKILSVSSPEGGEIIDPVTDNVFSVPVVSGGRLRLNLRFSLMFDPENPAVREECALKIPLNVFFPASLPPISHRTALWVSPDTLFLEWEGISAGSPDEPHYYKLVIPGGSAGIHNGMGSYIKEDLILFLEAES